MRTFIMQVIRKGNFMQMHGSHFLQGIVFCEEPAAPKRFRKLITRLKNAGLGSRLVRALDIVCLKRGEFITGSSCL